jgi:eukaryotic translation initiation factor 2C
MMCGARVLHPAKSRPTVISGKPIVAALVASVDEQFVQYPASMRIQDPHEHHASRAYVLRLMCGALC